MSAVVDLGCYDDTDAFSSIAELAEAFHPRHLFGWDIRSETRTYEIGDTEVSEHGAAAWTYDGEVGCVFDGTGTCLGSEEKVPCFDFSAWLKDQGHVDAVKMDIEGSEYQLLEKMHADGTDELVGLLIIEWHRDEKVSGLRCPVIPWWN